jgi:membrane protease YdiL (CAAX protease family)
MLDRKGLFSYLAITFGLTYAIEGAMILAGFRLTGQPVLVGQLIIAGVMWVPTLATILTIKFVTHEGFGITNFRLGSWKPYLASAITVPLAFVATYLLTWVLGLGSPDWQISGFYGFMVSAGADPATLPPPGAFLLLMFLVSLIVGPTINGLFGFGEEFGWRGYLLPKLMPLGKTRAYLIGGIIWGLWHAPLILVGFNYPGYPVLGVIWMCGLTTALSLYINEMTLRHRSSILAGWIHGAFNGQAYGIWRILFPSVNPLLGGLTGLVGIAVWTAIGLWHMRRRG